MRDLIGFVRLRSAWLLLASVWLLFFYDFGSRAFVGRDATLRKFESPTVPGLPRSIAAGAVEQALKDWMPVTGLNATAEKKLSLEAVLGRNGQPKAVIIVRSMDGVFEARRMVTVGEEIEGWKLTNLDRMSATLNRAEPAETKVLRMFPARPGATP